MALTAAHLRMDDYVTHQIVCPRCGLQRPFVDLKAATREVARLTTAEIYGRSSEACACEGLCQCG